MTHAEFVYPAYALTVAGLAGVTLWSFVAMRRAEAASDRTTRRTAGGDAAGRARPAARTRR